MVYSNLTNFLSMQLFPNINEKSLNFMLLYAFEFKPQNHIISILIFQIFRIKLYMQVLIFENLKSRVGLHRRTVHIIYKLCIIECHPKGRIYFHTEIKQIIS